MSSFPHAVRTFVGRDAELARLAALLSTEVVCLVYGVAGIGKTELCYRAVERAGAAALLWQAAPGTTVDDAVAALLSQLRRGRPARAGAAAGDLAALTAALDRRAVVVLLDDAHHLEPGPLGALLAHLARHLRRGRVLVTSRVEIALPAGAPPPAVVRLAPLAERDVGELGTRLAALRGVPAPDARELHRLSGGSPFGALRAFAAAGAASDDALADELAGLVPAARAALLTAALGRGRLAPDELGAPAAVVATLTRRFLVDVERGPALVHDLVRDALLARAAPDEVAAARRAVARALLARDTPLDAALAVQELVAAGDAAEAWAAYRREVPAMAAAGLTHLLLDALRALGRALPGERLAIDLARARALLARSRVAEARALLVRAARTPAGRAAPRCRMLLGTALERAGRLRRAEGVFREALALTGDPHARFQTLLEIANVTSMRGDGAAARVVLGEARRARPAPTARERRHLRYAAAVSYLYEERYAPAVRAARTGDVPVDPVAAELGLFEMLARAELDDLEGARRLLAEVRAAGHDDPSVAAYGGAVRVIAGELAGVRRDLERQHRELEAHAHRTLALVAGHYLAWALLGLGDPEAAARVAERMAARAREGEMESTVAHNRAVVALAALEAGRTGDARVHAAALVSERGAERARFWAHVVRARLAGLAGRTEEARAELARAVRAAPAGERAALAGLADLELAEIECAVDPGRALAHAARAAARYAAAGRRHLEARALAAQALALVATGEEADRLLAARALASARALAERAELAPVLARVRLGEAALERAAGDDATADAMLEAALAAAPGPASALATQLLRAARARLQPPGVPAGVEALVAALGFRGGPRWRVRARAGVVAAAGAGLPARLGEHDLVIDLARHAIAAPGTGRELAGRPVACALLARLVESDPSVVGAETLYLDVWRGREYHALRHRNTVYVGMSRLRRALERLLPGRTVVETAPTGWRLARDVRAAVVEGTVSTTSHFRPNPV